MLYNFTFCGLLRPSATFCSMSHAALLIVTRGLLQPSTACGHTAYRPLRLSATFCSMSRAANCLSSMRPPRIWLPAGAQHVMQQRYIKFVKKYVKCPLFFAKMPLRNSLYRISHGSLPQTDRFSDCANFFSGKKVQYKIIMRIFAVRLRLGRTVSY